MKKKPSSVKAAESGIKTSVASLIKFGSQVKETAGKFDKKHGISDRTSTLAKGIGNALNDFDNDHHVIEKAIVVGKSGRKALVATVKGTKKYSDESGITNKVKRTGEALKKEVIEPFIKWADESGTTKKIGEATIKVIGGYGKTRALIKPYFAPETLDELLETTKSELIYINACIFQVSQGEAEKFANKLGTAIVSKIAGAASVGTLLGLVSTFGTASTGTAIAGLHGAALSSATLAWVGGLLGGGMATGVVLTGGVGLAVGISLYKFISSEARQFTELSETERRIVEANGFLIAAINDVLDNPEKALSVDEADMLLQNTLIPLHQSLLDHCDEICKNLDTTNRIALQQHAIPDFKKSVIDGFESFVQEETESRRRYPEYVVAGVIYALLTRSAVDDSRESQLALKAIRRLKTEWNEASNTQLSADLARYDPEQLKGIANNAKGIYHEMLFIDDYNNSHEDAMAELFPATNHPGADIQIRSTETGEVEQVFQLKATDNEGLIKEHFEKYPDIDVLATEEFAMQSALAGSSDISNQVITEKMDGTLADISDNTIADRTVEGVEIVGLVAAGREAIRVLNGKQSVNEAGVNVVKAMTVTATSTALVAYLFS